MQVEDVRAPEEVPQPDFTAATPDQKTLLTNITGLFTPNKLKLRPTSDSQCSAAPVEKQEHGHSVCLDWADGYMPRGKAEISEACRQAFTAICHLLLEWTTFPIYFSEEETLALNRNMFGPTGQHTVG